MKHAIPDEVLRHHTAVVGKTGAGKTSTEKLIIEQVVAGGARVCVLDTLKSDWWGITSSSSGKSAGLPFQILGGPRGHVPLHSSAGKAIGNLVGTGKLPLSIVDMADFEPGGIQRFFVDFAQSLWKSARGVVYLVIEEAHEIAPKERAGFGAENMAIHWAKKLATGSRTKGIKLVVATQRVQALHNAVLGSCETLVVHRLTMDADQEPVVKWLKSANKTKAAEVGDTLASLPTGTGWICSGEAQIFEKVAFPKFKTFDNTATPDSGAVEIDVKTAPVDDAALRTLIGEEVKKAEADDPKKLRDRIGLLERDNRKLEQERDAARTARPPVGELQEAERIGFEKGKAAVTAEAMRVGQGVIVSALQDLRKLAAPLVEALDAGIKTAKIAFPDVSKNVTFQSGPPTVKQTTMDTPTRAASSAAVARKPSPVPAGGDGSIPSLGAERRPLGALASVYPAGMSEAQWAVAAGLRRSGGTWSTYLSRLRTAGCIEKRGDLFFATDIGMAACGENIVTAPPPGPELVAFWKSKISGIGPMLDALAAHYPGWITREGLAAEIGLAASGGTFSTYLSRLRSPGLIEVEGQDLRCSPSLMGEA